MNFIYKGAFIHQAKPNTKQADLKHTDGFQLPPFKLDEFNFDFFNQ